MSNKRIHIVSLDVPYPADYGGAIDIFYRTQALHSAGFEVILHCYEYGRGTPEALKKITTEVHYYSREKKFIDWLSQKPFIVKTRASKELLNSLLKDNAPILFEGLHTCFHLANPELRNRIKLVRTHNIEHDYYSGLAQFAKEPKRTYFRTEAKKLERYESILKHASHILAIQQNDVNHFKNFNKNVHLLPASMPAFKELRFEPTNPYCLFHGNLSVPENEHAALWIISQFSGSKIRLIIAGKSPSDTLKKACKKWAIELVKSPNEKVMEGLIQRARIHALYTHQATGLKLKLINALNSSGHVLVNAKVIHGSGLEDLCTIANTSTEYKNKLKTLIENPLSEDDALQRQMQLRERFSPQKTTELIARLIND